MPTKAPKILDIPDIEGLPVKQEVKDWLRRFSSEVSFALRSLYSDVVELDKGDTTHVGDSEREGSWRLRNDGTDLHVEVRLSQSWIDRFVFTRGSAEPSRITANWRWLNDNRDLHIQRKIDKVWTSKRTFEGITGEHRLRDDDTDLLLEENVSGETWETRHTWEGATGTHVWVESGSNLLLKIDGDTVWTLEG